MTLTLELTPDAEEKLRRKASQRGQELNDYAQNVLLTDADAPAVPTGEDLPAPPVPPLLGARGPLTPLTRS